MAAPHLTHHPAPYSDTDPRAMEVWLEVIRKKTPGERLMMALELTDFAFKLSEQGVRARYPNASDREVFLRAAALRIPRDLMIRAYGWDPESQDPEVNGDPR
jgi:hypothetical protein